MKKGRRSSGALFHCASGLLRMFRLPLNTCNCTFSGIMLKKFKAFAGEPGPFIMELLTYHAPPIAIRLDGGPHYWRGGIWPAAPVMGMLQRLHSK